MWSDETFTNYDGNQFYVDFWIMFYAFLSPLTIVAIRRMLEPPDEEIQNVYQDPETEMTKLNQKQTIEASQTNQV